LAILYAILGHSLPLQADIHHLESTAEHLSSVGSSASNPPGGNHLCGNHLWNLTQAEKISLSNRWFAFSLGLLMSPEGNIHITPTVFGIRAMAALGFVKHASVSLDSSFSPVISARA
jgi:hypothetical protein